MSEKKITFNNKKVILTQSILFFAWDRWLSLQTFKHKCRKIKQTETNGKGRIASSFNLKVFSVFGPYCCSNNDKKLTNSVVYLPLLLLVVMNNLQESQKGDGKMVDLTNKNTVNDILLFVCIMCI